jgi:hypothetical protein
MPMNVDVLTTRVADRITVDTLGSARRIYFDEEMDDALTEALDGFVDVLARRIASFDRRRIAAAKNLINQVSLPYADRLLDALNAFQTALTWPETQQRIQCLKRGLRGESDLENRWPVLLGTLLET